MDLADDKAISNLAPLLPGMLRIATEDRGRVPMRLDDFFPFEDVFSTHQPPRSVHRGSRQVGKTVQLGARIILECALRPGTRVIVVTPLQEQSDLLSSGIFRPLIDESPIRTFLSDSDAIGNIRRRPFKNDSIIQFSYALGNTLRIRSKTGRILYVDEGQHMDPADIADIQQSTSASKMAQMWTSGTSRTKDTFLEAEWESSSQGIWQIKCSICGFTNICCIEPDGHLLAMIGDPHEDISEQRPGTLCKQCRQPISPRQGCWVHRFPERVRDYVGYHTPQPIFPVHYAHPHKWKQLVGFMKGGYSTGKFYNECLGEAYDVAYKLVSIDDLKKAATLGPNTEAEGIRRSRFYQFVVAGVDWGGGGDDGVSRTKVAICGLNSDGGADVFFGAGFQPSTDRVAETQEIIRFASLMRVQLIAHDIGGGIGTASESTMVHLGWPLSQIVPIRYQGVEGSDMFVRHPANDNRSRMTYSLHKSKSLQFLCHAIRYGKVRFFQYDYRGKDDPGHLHDFLSLVEDKVDTPTGGTYRIRRSSKTLCDDFSAATNYGLCALWEYTGSWPSLVSFPFTRN